MIGLGAIRSALGIDTRFPDSRPSRLPMLYKRRARNRRANKAARAARRHNRR